MKELAERVSLLGVSPIRKVSALLDQAKCKGEIISFGGGAPSLPPPMELLNELCDLLTKDPISSLRYTGTRGIPELRRAISEDVAKYSGLEYDPEREIIVTDGGTEAIYLALMTLLNPSDEVIILDPTYLGYAEAIKLAGGKPITLSVKVEDGYQPSQENLERLITPRTKAFLLLSPDNPTGRLISREFAENLVECAVKNDFWILSDDIYKHILYEGEHVYVSRFSGARERTVTLCSFSKEASVPGFRIGYALGPAHVIDGIEKVKQYTSLASYTPSMYAMVKFLATEMKEKYLRETVIPLYKKRMEFMGSCLKKYLPEAKTVKPAGAFYYFVDMRSYLSDTNTSDEEFCQRLLREKNVVVIPGSYFGVSGKQHVRMTFVSESEERTEAGIKAISEIL